MADFEHWFFGFVQLQKKMEEEEEEERESSRERERSGWLRIEELKSGERGGHGSSGVGPGFVSNLVDNGSLTIIDIIHNIPCINTKLLPVCKLVNPESTTIASSSMAALAKCHKDNQHHQSWSI
ncbi:hypothetical protein PanWU01x14_112850 [Parasponia andersonii]|uniref:Uncharacterized protein n=1 Tax=Parasponia andersonii TaxID=3476 RepID=A0A2P5CYD6_PARAD|nr:hypothetical protein PanWU01x14_112850 [Parasponia andersonii]